MSTITIRTGTDRRIASPNFGQDITEDISVGDFLQYLLVSDTGVVEVIKVTEKTVTVASTKKGEMLEKKSIDGNPFPIVYTEAVSDPNGSVQTLRKRKDGSIRMYDSILRRADSTDGRPVYRTDYRY